MISLLLVTLRIVKSIYIKGKHKRNQTILRPVLPALIPVLPFSSWFPEKLPLPLGNLIFLTERSSLPSSPRVFPYPSCLGWKASQASAKGWEMLLTELRWTVKRCDWYSWMCPSCSVFFVAAGLLIFYFIIIFLRLIVNENTPLKNGHFIGKLASLTLS